MEQYVKFKLNPGQAPPADDFSTGFLFEEDWLVWIGPYGQFPSTDPASGTEYNSAVMTDQEIANFYDLTYPLVNDVTTEIVTGGTGGPGGTAYTGGTGGTAGTGEAYTVDLAVNPVNAFALSPWPDVHYSEDRAFDNDVSTLFITSPYNPDDMNNRNIQFIGYNFLKNACLDPDKAFSFGDYDSNYPPSNAFDNDYDTRWVSNKTTSDQVFTRGVGFQFDVEKVIRSIMIKQYLSTQTMSDFEVWASDFPPLSVTDGRCLAQFHYTWQTYDTYKIFNFNNEVGFKYYWLRCEDRYISSSNYYCSIESIRMTEQHNDFNFVNINRLKLYCGKYPGLAPNKFDLRGGYYPPKVVNDGTLIKSFDNSDDLDFWTENAVKEFLVKENTYLFPFYWIDMKESQEKYGNIQSYYISDFEMEEAHYTEDLATEDVINVFTYNGEENNRNNIINENPDAELSCPFPGFFGIELLHGKLKSDYSGYVIRNSEMSQYPATNVQYDNMSSWKNYNSIDGYVGHYFHFPKVINKVRIRCDFISNAPLNFEIRAGDSGTTPSGTAGTLLLTVDGRDNKHGFWSKNVAKDFEFPNHIAYQKYWIWMKAKDSETTNVWDYELIQVDWIYEERSYPISKSYNVTTSDISQIDVSGISNLKKGQILKHLINDQVSLSWLFSTDGRQTWKKYSSADPFVVFSGNYSHIFVIKNGPTDYETWCDNESTNKIHYFTSFDLFTFETEEEQTHIGLNPNGYDSSRSKLRHIIKESDTLYRMWYSGYDGTNWYILYTTSEDGINWENSIESFNVSNLFIHSILYVHSPFVLKESESLYKMWFTGYNGSKSIIFYCESSDGVTWGNFKKCVDSKLTDTYFYNGVDNAKIVKEGPNEYRMYATGVTNNVTRVILFLSEDGVNWTFDQVIIDVHMSENSHKIHLQLECLFKDEDGLYRMWYSNYQTSYEVLYVESSDGINFLTPHEQLVKLDEIIDSDYSTEVPTNHSLMSSEDMEIAIPKLDLTDVDTLDFFTLLDSVHHNVSPVLDTVKLSKNVIERKFDINNTEFIDSDDMEAAAIQWKQFNTSSILLNPYFDVYSITNCSAYTFINGGSVTLYANNGRVTLHAYFTLPAGAFITSWAHSYGGYAPDGQGFQETVTNSNIPTSGITAVNRYPLSRFHYWLMSDYDERTYFYWFHLYGYMPSAVYYLALCKLRKTAYITNSPATVITTSEGQIDMTGITLITSFDVSYSEPENTTIRVLVSFDNKGTWKKYNPTSTFWEDHSIENISSGNTIADLISGMTDFDVTSIYNFDFAIYLLTETSSSTPEIYSISINSGEAELSFDRSEKVETSDKIVNSMELRNNGCRSPIMIPTTEYSEDLCLSTINVFHVGFTNYTYCFNHNLSNQGYSNNGPRALVGYHFPEKYCITKVIMSVITTDSGPNHFQIRASDTQPTQFGEGDLLLEVNEHLTDYWTSGVPKEFEFDNDGFYEYYWIECLNKFGDFGQTYEYYICDITMYSIINEYYVTYDPNFTHNNVRSIMQTNDNSQFDVSLIDVIDKIKLEYLRPEGTDLRILFSFDGRQTWQKYEHKCVWTPILREQRFLNGYFGRGVRDSCIIKESDTSYKMWTSVSIGLYYKYIIYMRSTDGINWTNPKISISKNTIGTYDSDNILYPYVIKEHETSYKMWYGGADGTNWRILYATSTDGVNWENHQLVIDLNIIGIYDTVYIHNPCVIKESELVYKMWYSGYDGTNTRILYAESTDGVNWNNHQLIIDIGMHDRIDAKSVSRPRVIYSESDSKYIMFYSIYDVDEHNYIGIATSEDGVNWTIIDPLITKYHTDYYQLDNITPPHSHSVTVSDIKAAFTIDDVIKDGDIYKIWSRISYSTYYYFSFYRTVKNFDDLFSPHYVQHNLESCPQEGNTIEEIEELFTNYDSSEFDTLDFAIAFRTKDYLVSPTLKSINLYHSSEVIDYDSPTKIIQEDSEIGTAIVNNRLQLKNFESGTFLCDDVVFSNDISITTGSIYNLFEDTVGTYSGGNSLQVSEYPVQITYDLGEYLTRVVDRYIISIPTDAFPILYYPTDWTFEGSNDGIDWDILDTQVAFTNWVLNGGNNEFKFTNNTEYRYYRWVFTAGPSSVCSLSKLELFVNQHPSRIITKVSLVSYDSPTLMPTFFQIRAGNSVPTGMGQGVLLKEFDFRQYPGYWSNNDVKSYFIEHNNRYSHYWLDIYAVESVGATTFTIGRLRIYANGPDVIATGGTGGTGGSA